MIKYVVSDFKLSSIFSLIISSALYLRGCPTPLLLAVDSLHFFLLAENFYLENVFFSKIFKVFLYKKQENPAFSDQDIYVCC